jgi:hypothetical protein
MSNLEHVNDAYSTVTSFNGNHVTEHMNIADTVCNTVHTQLRYRVCKRQQDFKLTYLMPFTVIFDSFMAVTLLLCGAYTTTLE